MAESLLGARRVECKQPVEPCETDEPLVGKRPVQQEVVGLGMEPAIVAMTASHSPSLTQRHAFQLRMMRDDARGGGRMSLAMRAMQLVRLDLELIETGTGRESTGRHARSFRKTPGVRVRAERSVIRLSLVARTLKVRDER